MRALLFWLILARLPGCPYGLPPCVTADLSTYPPTYLLIYLPTMGCHHVWPPTYLRGQSLMVAAHSGSPWGQHGGHRGHRGHGGHGGYGGHSGHSGHGGRAVTLIISQNSNALIWLLTAVINQGKNIFPGENQFWTKMNAIKYLCSNT